MKIRCIYKITSKTLSRIYVGSANNFKRRKYLHLWDLKNNRHHSKKLQRHFDKYGIDDIEFHIIEEVPNDVSIVSREQFYIDLLKPYFNSCPIAGNCTGRSLSEETKKKIGEKNKGRTAWNKGLAGSAPDNRGRVHSIEVRKKLSEAHKGIKHTEETKAKMRLSHQGPRPYRRGVTLKKRIHGI